jgi:hypothetical protein
VAVILFRDITELRPGRKTNATRFPSPTSSHRFAHRRSRSLRAVSRNVAAQKTQNSLQLELLPNFLKSWSDFESAQSAWWTDVLSLARLEGPGLELEPKRV